MKTRYTLFTIFVLLGVSGYYVHLLYYLQQISNPYPLITIFFGSLLIALVSEFTEGFNRLALAGIGATMLYFNIATEIAIFVRELVLIYIDENVVKGSLENQLQLGQEYIQSASNKIVSIGACMGGSLIASRVILYRLFRKMFLIVLNAKETTTIAEENS